MRVSYLGPRRSPGRSDSWPDHLRHLQATLKHASTHSGCQTLPGGEEGPTAGLDMPHRGTYLRRSDDKLEFVDKTVKGERQAKANTCWSGQN